MEERGRKSYLKKESNSLDKVKTFTQTLLLFVGKQFKIPMIEEVIVSRPLGYRFIWPP